MAQGAKPVKLDELVGPAGFILQCGIMGLLQLKINWHQSFAKKASVPSIIIII